MNENKLLQFANTKIGRKYFGVPVGKEVIKITNGSVHYYTGKLSKNPKNVRIMFGKFPLATGRED